MSPEESLVKEGFSVHSWSNGPGFFYPVHDHSYQKAIVVLKGSISFYLPAEKKEILMKSGDRLDLPRGTAHSATVGPGGVTCLEGHKA